MLVLALAINLLRAPLIHRPEPDWYNLRNMEVLGIETSCDETSAAIVSDGLNIRANVIASQADLHARYGGVVPEVASRMHVERLLPVLRDCLAGASMTWADIGAVAVTNRPGLLGALLVGVTAAKSIGLALRIPVVPIHHLEGHIYSAFLERPELIRAFPLTVLVVSGGHTLLIEMSGHGRYRLLGQTRDDAAGEAFDKGARLLGLAYPGGPNLERLAAQGDQTRVPFPQSMLGESLDFSFSGVKTALRNRLAKELATDTPADVAASYQAAIVSVLVEKARRAVVDSGTRVLCLAGGVAANDALYTSMSAMAASEGVMLVRPSSVLCTDNAAMIASAGHFRLTAGVTGELGFDTMATEPLATA